MELNYKQDVQIDINALDIEWLKQTELEQAYIEQASHLRKEARLAEEEVKTVRSELISEANEDPQECCNKDKPNAGDIEAYYRTHKKYKQAKQEFIEAQEAAQVADDMKNLIHFTRVKALENLVQLNGQGYFAGPSTPRNINRELERREEQKKEREEKKKERISKLSSKMKRRT